MTAKATAYELILFVDLEAGTECYSINTYDGTEPISRIHQETVTTFCHTWQDVVKSIESVMMFDNWKPNNLHRPSPYVDLS